MIIDTLFVATKFSIKAGWEILISLPRLFAMRRRHPATTKAVVLLFSECGDEVNGIAKSTRELMHVLRNLRKDALYITPAHSTRNRYEWETTVVCVVPQAVSMNVPGYPGVEMAFPRLKPLLKIIFERKVTHVEILTTPCLGGLMLVPVFRLIGLSVSFQYRTDIFAYGPYLGIPKFMMGICHTTLGWVLKSSNTIGLPSATSVAILARHYPQFESRMVVLQRGFPMHFVALLKKVESRRSHYVKGPPKEARRFFYLGRISKEKNLALLVSIWKSDISFRDIPLTFFGDGPFKDELAMAFSGYNQVTFPGLVATKDLPERLCEMDFLIFPSGTDTLGQSVLESLCMGIPALVSDKGGPAEMILTKGNGFVLPMDDLNAWSSCVRHCAAMGTNEYGLLSRQARRHATSLDPIFAAEHHWNYWVSPSQAGLPPI